jgi:hypothetical protein
MALTSTICPSTAREAITGLGVDLQPGALLPKNQVLFVSHTFDVSKYSLYEVTR